MAEYIEKKAALDAVWQGCGACAEEVEQLPVVEIVRCGECVLHGVCTYERGLGKDGFCNQGKRKEGEESGTDEN